MVVEANRVPVGVATDGANVSEPALGAAAVASVPKWLRRRSRSRRVPVIADRAYDSDPLRGYVRRLGCRLIAPHRSNRVKPRTADGRELRRYRRRWKIEQAFAWLHSYRRVMTRHERRMDLYDGFVHLACAFMAINKLL